MSEIVERMKGGRIIKKIVYGNTAKAFGYKRDSDGHTHTWTIFLRPYGNDDMSKYIRKVQFKLHDSYPNATRVVEEPPYELTESGWGEFEVQIRIFFVDSNEKSVTAFHYLRLFQPVFHLPGGDSIVVSEFYDELIFQEPTLIMYKALTTAEGKGKDHKAFWHDLEQLLKRTEELGKHALVEVSKEVEDLVDSLKAAHQLITRYREEVDNDSASNTPNTSFSQA